VESDAEHCANITHIQFTHATNPGISFAVNMRVAYKTALPTTAAF
jgi:hypothetical protein